MLVAATLLSGLACAAPTDLDWRWDGDGMLFPALSDGGYVKQFLLQPDGALLVGVQGAAQPHVARFDVAGQPNLSFGTGGRIERPSSPDSFWDYDFAGIALLGSGRLLAQWYYFQRSPSLAYCLRAWSRHLPSGQLDVAFGVAGTVGFVDQGRLCGGRDQFSSSGNAYRIEYIYYLPTPDSDRHVVRTRSSDGAEGRDIHPFDTARFSYVTLAIDSLDRLLIGLRSRQGPTRGFMVGRTGVGAFGSSGVAFAPLPGSPALAGVLPLPGGGVLAYGSIGDIDAMGARQAAIVRFTEDGEPDAAFGEGGAAIIPFARAGDLGVRQLGVVTLPDGRLLVVAEVDGWLDAYRRFVHLRMARLMPDGSPDTSFAENGIATVPSNGETLLRDGPLIRPSGEFLVASSDVIYQFRGGDLAQPYPPTRRTAVEYFHAGYGHYFVTADVLEIATLDASPASGWARTGKSFNVYGSNAAQLAPVCRFWSGQSYAPKSSHFYTPYTDECAQVKQNPVWLFERNAFYLRMPEGMPGARTCPADTQPFYRAYNDGQGGAPNHRYTTDPALLDAMIAQGWIMEGEAQTRVFACLPVQD